MIKRFLGLCVASALLFSALPAAAQGVPTSAPEFCSKEASRRNIFQAYKPYWEQACLKVVGDCYLKVNSTQEWVKRCLEEKDQALSALPKGLTPL